MIGCFRPQFCTVRLYWASGNLAEWDEFDDYYDDDDDEDDDDDDDDYDDLLFL